MLDWEAPTGGYLLTACFSTGRVAGQGAAAWVQGRSMVQGQGDEGQGDGQEEGQQEGQAPRQ
jgi:hypothetical protein